MQLMSRLLFPCITFSLFLMQVSYGLSREELNFLHTLQHPFRIDLQNLAQYRSCISSRDNLPLYCLLASMAQKVTRAFFGTSKLQREWQLRCAWQGVYIPTPLEGEQTIPAFGCSNTDETQYIVAQRLVAIIDRFAELGAPIFAIGKEGIFLAIVFDCFDEVRNFLRQYTYNGEDDYVRQVYVAAQWGRAQILQLLLTQKEGQERSRAIHIAWEAALIWPLTPDTQEVLNLLYDTGIMPPVGTTDEFGENVAETLSKYGNNELLRSLNISKDLPASTKRKIRDGLVKFNQPAIWSLLIEEGVLDIQQDSLGRAVQLFVASSDDLQQALALIGQRLSETPQVAFEREVLQHLIYLCVKNERADIITLIFKHITHQIVFDEWVKIQRILWKLHRRRQANFLFALSCSIIPEVLAYPRDRLAVNLAEGIKNNPLFERHHIIFSLLLWGIFTNDLDLCTVCCTSFTEELIPSFAQWDPRAKPNLTNWFGSHPLPVMRAIDYCNEYTEPALKEFLQRFCNGINSKVHQ